MRIIIVGAGGHGQVVADALLASRRSTPYDLELLGFADDDVRLRGCTIGQSTVLGPTQSALSLPHDGLVVAVGDNHTRRELMRALALQGESFYTVLHPSAVVAADVTIGPGSVVLAGAVINTGSRLEAGIILNTCASVDHHSQVGAFVHVAPGAHTGGSVRIGEGAFIGLGASIVPKCLIGAWATVGAGATVIDDVPARATVVGTPARIIKQAEEVR